MVGFFSSIDFGLCAWSTIIWLLRRKQQIMNEKNHRAERGGFVLLMMITHRHLHLQQILA